MMSKGIHQDYLDKEIRPGDDFYMFVNGGWMKTTEIPADRSSWGSFHELGKNTDEKVLDILDEELSIPGPAQNKAARLFESGMDTTTIEKAKLEAVIPIIERVKDIKTYEEIIPLLGMLISKGMGAMMHFGVHPDLGNSRIYSPYLEAGGLGLPERDFYLEQDDKAVEIRKQYQDYIIDVLHKEHNVAHKTAFHLAEHIISLETELAGKMMSKEERRELDKIYNPFSFAELSSRFAKIDWQAFFASTGITPPERIIVTDPAYFDYLQVYLPTVSIDTLK